MAGVIGGKTWEALEWAAKQENNITGQFGAAAVLIDQWDEARDMNQPLRSSIWWSLTRPRARRGARTRTLAAPWNAGRVCEAAMIRSARRFQTVSL